LHLSGRGLEPKRSGSFSDSACYGEAKYDEGWNYGESEANAVLRHQLDQKGLPTVGISTTPSYERAAYYATFGGRRTGYVYKIDRESLAAHRVREVVVGAFTPAPSIPEDQEVILVSVNGGALPEALILETSEVRAQ
jgi:hypothetical protein